MTIDDFLARLGGVRARGPGRWTARCPAHDDRTPSLCVAEGERAILLRCWAGCKLQDICAALGVGVGDLFYARRGATPYGRRWKRRTTRSA